MTILMGTIARRAIIHWLKNSSDTGEQNMNPKLIIGIILAGLAALFIIQNVTVVDMRFLFWTLSMSRALLMLLILAIGIVLGWLLHGSFSRRKRSAHIKRDAPEGRSIA
jgi:lipopolysaccharide assembly protein A